MEDLFKYKQKYEWNIMYSSIFILVPLISK